MLLSVVLVDGGGAGYPRWMEGELGTQLGLDQWL